MALFGKWDAGGSPRRFSVKNAGGGAHLPRRRAAFDARWAVDRSRWAEQTGGDH